MILLTVWDGLRPDLISTEHTPFLARMAAEGVTCRASHAVWPSATRINAASLSTGAYPAGHGLVDNELYVPALDPSGPISCADWRALQDMADLEGGPLLTARTLGEILASAGRRMASGGSGSPGTTYLTNPTLTGPIINWAVAWPEAFQSDLVRRRGLLLTQASSSEERNRLVIGALREIIFPEYQPDLVTLWLTEPDHAQHEHGLLSDEACAMLRHVDAEVQALYEHLAATQGEALTCFVLSDHGFDTIGPHVDIARELVAAGLKQAPESTDTVCAGCSIYLPDDGPSRAPDVAAWLLAQPWIGAVLVRDDLAPACPGTLPFDAARVGHRRSAQIMFSYRWTDAANDAGVPGTVHGKAGLAATHGSVSPYALRNTLIAWGAGIKRRLVSDVPCGIVDVAPTVLRLLGLPVPAEMDGRVLEEILEGGPEPAELRGWRETRHPETTGGGVSPQVAHYSAMDGHAYLDCVTRG